MTWFLWILTALLLLASWLKDRERSRTAFRVALTRLWKITPLFLVVMAIYALSITAIPQELIRQSIGGESGWKGMAMATGLGSVAIMPGFVAFPLCAALHMQGVPYAILAAFSLSLMNVGVATFPLEKHYLGWRVAVWRNLIGLGISLLVAAAMALVLGGWAP